MLPLTTLRRRRIGCLIGMLSAVQAVPTIAVARVPAEAAAVDVDPTGRATPGACRVAFLSLSGPSGRAPARPVAARQTRAHTTANGRQKCSVIYGPMIIRPASRVGKLKLTFCKHFRTRPAPSRNINDKIEL